MPKATPKCVFDASTLGDEYEYVPAPKNEEEEVVVTEEEGSEGGFTPTTEKAMMLAEDFGVPGSESRKGKGGNRGSSRLTRAGTRTALTGATKTPSLILGKPKCDARSNNAPAPVKRRSSAASVSGQEQDNKNPEKKSH